MKAKKPTRTTATGSSRSRESAKKPQANRKSRGARETKRVPVDAPPRGGRKAARDARPARSAPRTTPITRPAEVPARPKSASQAKARAKARKAKAPKVVRPPLRERILVKLASIELNPRRLVSRVPFVVLVISALGDLCSIGSPWGIQELSHLASILLSFRGLLLVPITVIWSIAAIVASFPPSYCETC